MTDVAIYGCGGLGRVVRDILLATGHRRVVAFLDSDPARHGCSADGLPIYGGLAAIERVLGGGALAVVVAIGDNQARVAIAERLRQQGVPLASAIHPLATIAPSARLADHVILGARTTICVHATVGRHCVLSTGSILDHDNSLGKGVFLHPAVRLAGGVQIDDYATLGIGACVIPYRRIGARVHIEPGSVVIRDVPAGLTVGGVPAQERDQHTSRFLSDRKPSRQPQPA